MLFNRCIYIYISYLDDPRWTPPGWCWIRDIQPFSVKKSFLSWPEEEPICITGRNPSHYEQLFRVRRLDSAWIPLGSLGSLGSPGHTTTGMFYSMGIVDGEGIVLPQKSQKSRWPSVTIQKCGRDEALVWWNSGYHMGKLIGSTEYLWISVYTQQ